MRLGRAHRYAGSIGHRQHRCSGTLARAARLCNAANDKTKLAAPMPTVMTTAAARVTANDRPPGCALALPISPPLVIWSRLPIDSPLHRLDRDGAVPHAIILSVATDSARADASVAVGIGDYTRGAAASDRSLPVGGVAA